MLGRTPAASGFCINKTANHVVAASGCINTVVERLIARVVRARHVETRWRAILAVYARRSRRVIRTDAPAIVFIVGLRICHLCRIGDIRSGSDIEITRQRAFATVDRCDHIGVDPEPFLRIGHGRADLRGRRHRWRFTVRTCRPAIVAGVIRRKRIGCCRSGSDVEGAGQCTFAAVDRCDHIGVDPVTYR